MARRGAIINTVGRDLEKWRTDVVKQTRNLTINAVTDVEIKATRSLTRNSDPQLNLNFIIVQKKISKAGMKGEVGVMGDDPLPAYIEFGTGLSAASILAPYPQWVKDIAMEFYVNGQGTLQGRPYLYNNFLIVEAQYKVDLQKILDKERKS